MPKDWDDFFTPRALELLDKNIELALAEDGPDWSSMGIFPEGSLLTGRIVAKEKTIVAGLPLIGMVMRKIGSPFGLRLLAKEGSTVAVGTAVAAINAPAKALLEGERPILNYITHLSGVANLAAKYARELDGTGTRLLDTRKTLPGLRWLEKYAVQLAGGENHRMSLSDMLMLKDNHIDGAGSIQKAVASLRATHNALHPPCPPIEVECRSIDEVRQALAAGADRIMLDNMRGAALSEALAMIPRNVETEISGGVTLENIRALALTKPRGPDYISVGRLTHSAPAADFSMCLEQV